jgi:hypothetical protein
MGDLNEFSFALRLFLNLSIHQNGDEDWFRFTTIGTNVTGHEISIVFDQRLGDLNLQVLLPDGGVLGSTNVSDRESVSLATLPRGATNNPFYVRVLGAVSNTHPNYTPSFERCP